ncbi:ABC transporter permease [Actinoplanes subtropicus]|uniref:ABC transporter permease n=1 Tax=Actinoplanes subtropicus TaxID=543632 RepID=UPI00068CBB96|nr:ABC transporter permease subunit [Actinoplanes subtropicus]
MGAWLRRTSRSANWAGVVVAAAVLTIWQLLVTLRLIGDPPLPGPIEIWRGFQELTVPGGGMWPAIGHTVQVVLTAWSIGAGSGCVLGLLLAANRTVASWAVATVDVLRSLPVVALIPIAILLWGTGNLTEVALGAYAALWPMLINTAGGARAVTPRLRDVARTMVLSRPATLLKIVLPATGASMLVGARLALSTTLVVCVVSEMLGLQSGIGNQLVLEQGAMQPARMWVYVLVTGVLGVVVNAGLIRAFRVAFPGIAGTMGRRGR